MASVSFFAPALELAKLKDLHSAAPRSSMIMAWWLCLAMSMPTMIMLSHPLCGLGRGRTPAPACHSLARYAKRERRLSNIQPIREIPQRRGATLKNRLPGPRRLTRPLPLPDYIINPHCWRYRKVPGNQGFAHRRAQTPHPILLDYPWQGRVVFASQISTLPLTESTTLLYEGGKQ